MCLIMALKSFYTYNEIHQILASLAKKILNSGFNPDYIVAIGSGGFIPARIIKTFINKPILTVGLNLYDSDKSGKIVKDIPSKIQWLDEAEKKIKNKNILLIDEIDDTRSTLAYCIQELLINSPKEIAVCVLHNKQKEKKAQFPQAISKIYVGENIVGDPWVFYPWDAEDINLHDKEKNLN